MMDIILQYVLLCRTAIEILKLNYRFGTQYFSKILVKPLLLALFINIGRNPVEIF